MNNDEIQVNSNVKLFSDLFTINDNKTVTEPLQKLMTIISNNDEEKISVRITY